MAKVKKAYRTEAELKKVQTVIESDGIDDLMFDSMRNAPKLEELCNTIEGEGITQDAFTSFFTHEPSIKEKSEVVQAGIFEQMMELPEFDSLRHGTKNDEVGAALAALQFAPEMIEKYIEIKKKVQEKKEQEGGKDPESLEDALSEDEMSGLRSALRKSLEKAQEAADKWEDTTSGWGMDKGELKSLPMEQKLALAERLGKESKLSKIAELAGKFRNIVNSSAVTIPIHGIDEIVDIGPSRDIAHMLPTELIKLIEAPDEFYMDYFEGKLITYNLKGEDPMGQGPIICCVDMSGSMSGGREEWSKAVVLALLSLAQKQRRGFAYIGFDTNVQISKYFPKGTQIGAEDKVEMATLFSGGGTDFYNPLKEAFAIRKKDISMKPADIIFITDGDCSLDSRQKEEILKAKKDTDTRIYSIAIDCYGTKSLEEFSDQVAGVSLNGDMKLDLVKDLVKATAAEKQKRI